MHEGPQTNEKVQFTLKTWFNQMEETQRNVIEAEIFNTSGSVDLETALDKIQDQEVARGIMTRLKGYLDLKGKGASKEVLVLEAKEIAKYIDGIIVSE